MLRTSDLDQHAIRIARSDIFRHLTADDLCACRGCVCLRYIDEVLPGPKSPILSLFRRALSAPFSLTSSGCRQKVERFSGSEAQLSPQIWRRDDKIYDCLLNAAFQLSVGIVSSKAFTVMLIKFATKQLHCFWPRNQRTETDQSWKKIFGHWTPKNERNENPQKHNKYVGIRGK